jgi:3-deoxy-D-manno-octulosonic-acid transferase
VLVEGDYWPLALELMRRRCAPVAVINGRISDRAFGRQRRFGRLNRLFYREVERFGLQSDDDRRRLLALGAPADRLVVTGNLKFDAPEPTRQPGLEAGLLRLAAGRPILVAGSTLEGEDEAVLEAFRRLGGGRRALLILVPRHPERWNSVDDLLSHSGQRHLRRSHLDTSHLDTSHLDTSHLDPGPLDPVDVLLLDSLGELAALYALATAVFIGGSLVPKGGHNPIEPALFGIPTAVGPSQFNFLDVAKLFDEAGAWRRVADAEGLAAIWKAWLEHPSAAKDVGERARALVARHRGAAVRSVALLAPTLAAAGLVAAEGQAR